ncbi:hypothetical protein [Neolewinella agarilytica]|uniref:hypothetical protein n=1 Tax=Neolewinella agarilytica TaxID=478744 RepID=UPI00111391C1|nr:hypothetical protein [Neolewinella agarilytica]
MKIDIVIPEGATSSDIAAKIQKFYTRVARRIELNESRYPGIDYRNIESVLDVKIDFGYD